MSEGTAPVDPPQAPEDESVIGQSSQEEAAAPQPARRQVVLPDQLPDGAQPVFLSSVTQKLFKVAFLFLICIHMRYGITTNFIGLN